MAFFQSLVRPWLARLKKRPRRALPLTTMVLTATTLIEFLASAWMNSMACAISYLLASLATMNVYLPCSPPRMVFSVTMGRWMI